MKDTFQPLTPPAFYVLLSLHERERHGYEIMKRVELDSDEQVRLGPGTLYGVIKRLLSEQLIEAAEMAPDPSGDERRRYYRLTPAGRRRLGRELRRFDEALSRARELGVPYHGIARVWTA